MSYSRRQLYAMGEPLGDSVTRKEGGRIVYGGGGSSAPASQTSITELPEWARGSAQKLLGKAEAVTDMTLDPATGKPKNGGYQTYGGDRLAGFSDLQNQAFTGVGQLAPSQLGGQAGQLAGAATYGALNTGYNPYQTGQFTSQTASQYMNPYLEQAMDPQLREAKRASEMQRTADQAQAVRAGAFGGSRQGIVEAERQRNLGTQMGDIRARGYQTAFDQAQQNFAREQQLQEQSRQYGAGLGLQGLQTTLQGAGMMGQLGGQQFGQAKDVLGLQSQFGAQQQAQEQAGLTQNYQDFLNEQKYPYQQLEFMSNILRGTPMGTVNTMYGAAPTMGQQIGALGMGAYGLSKLAGSAAGGSVSSYAGGGSVTDEDFVATAVQRLSDQQLQQELKDAQSEGDAARFKIVQTELSRRAQMRSSANSTGSGSGLSALFSEQMADKVLPGEESMARGGIVAFAAPTADNNYGVTSSEDDDEGDDYAAAIRRVAADSGGAGDPAAFSSALGEFDAAAGRIKNYNQRPMPLAEHRAAYTQALREQRDAAGPSPYDTLREEIAGYSQDRENNLSEGRGLAALQAASAMMQGTGFVQGLARAGGAFGQSYGQALQADRAEKKSLTSMKINLADAERKERMGMHEAAVRSADKARADYAAAQKSGLTRDVALANLAAKKAQITRPPKPGKPAAGPKLPEQLAAAEVAYAENPTEANLKRVTALRSAVSQYKTTDVGPTRAGLTQSGTDASFNAKVGAAIAKKLDSIVYTPEYRDASPAKRAQMAADIDRDVRRYYAANPEAEDMPTGTPPAPRASASAPARSASAPARPASSVNTNSPRTGQNDYSNLWK